MYFERCIKCYKKQKILNNNSDLKRTFLHSVQAVHGGNLIRKHVKLYGDKYIKICGRSYSLKNNFYLVGFGKAVYSMAVELESILGPKLVKGICLVPDGTLSSNEKHRRAKTRNIKFIEATNDNLPDKRSANAAKEILNLAESLEKDDLLIVLISGGGAALLRLPLSTIKLEEEVKLIKELAKGGANSYEINSVLKRISQIKGGGLARKTFPGYIVSLIISDVIGDSMYYIASGPTVPNKDLEDRALSIVKKYELIGKISHEMFLALDAPIYEDPAIALNPLEEYFHVENYILGNLTIAAEAAKQNAIRRGYQAAILSLSLTQDINKISQAYAQLALDLAEHLKGLCTAEYIKYKYSYYNVLGLTESVLDEILSFDFLTDKGVCLIAGGSPEFNSYGNGKDGRNQHLALQFSSYMYNQRANDDALRNVNVSLLCCGTEGIDGNTDAAGAIGTSDMYYLAKEEGINPDLFLANCDSYAFFELFRKGSYMVKTGYTGTKVMDMHIMIINKGFVFKTEHDEQRQIHVKFLGSFHC